MRGANIEEYRLESLNLAHPTGKLRWHSGTPLVAEHHEPVTSSAVDSRVCTGLRDAPQSFATSSTDRALPMQAAIPDHAVLLIGQRDCA